MILVEQWSHYISRAYTVIPLCHTVTAAGGISLFPSCSCSVVDSVAGVVDKQANYPLFAFTLFTPVYVYSSSPQGFKATFYS